MVRIIGVPGPPPGGGIGFGVNAPPPVITPPPPAAAPPCTAAQLWVPLETIATAVGVFPTFDPPDYGSEYDGAGLFTCVHSTNTFGEWEVDTTGILTPIMCAVIIESGALSLNIAFLICNNTYVYIEPGIYSPYFLLQPDTAGQLIQFYEFTDAGAENLATPVTFRVIAFPLTLP